MSECKDGDGVCRFLGASCQADDTPFYSCCSAVHFDSLTYSGEPLRLCQSAVAMSMLVYTIVTLGLYRNQSDGESKGNNATFDN